MVDLFENERNKAMSREAPLAARMRPRTFDEYVGQQHIVGPGKVLRLSIEADSLPSIILWGPPGSGKTTLAHLIANLTQSHFDPVSAVTAGVADLRSVVAKARERRGMYGQRTILFVDEIHRFNKAQQDVILPHVEEGTVTLIGATTENPSFEVVAPLLSRCRVFALKALTDEDVAAVVQRALEDDERGVGSLRVVLPDDALRHLAVMANGDARIALNALEMTASATAPDASGCRNVTLETVEDALQQRSLLYDKAGDQHYDTISAFIKSVRGSDPDAAVYWLGRMIEAGEAPMFIARRLVILAAEGCGHGRSTGAANRRSCSAGGPLHRDAGGSYSPGRGHGLPGHSAQEQLGLRRPESGDGGRSPDPQRPRTDAPSQCVHTPDAGYGLRRGLQVLPRLSRWLCSYGEPAGVTEGPALLQAHRSRPREDSSSAS